ncbi:MAG: DNA topoisomerase VI subunit B [Candidatus Marsarchaeota archaeon]|nr:DNA topoisomerase VI subunit B [Candidatus Marsarchaeota archaeon]
MPSDTDKIFANFKEHSVAEFFKKNKQMLGFSGKVRSLTIIVHEYVTNSIDACEEAGILPEITVKVDELDKEGERYRVSVQDNGPGIPKKHIGKALGQMLAGTKFNRYAQQRGQQGIGATGCTMYAQVTTGKPVKFVSEWDGKKLKGEISVDIKTNTPNIQNLVEEDNPDKKHGLFVQGEFGEVKYDRSLGSVFEYIKRTALSNPHVSLTLIEPNGEKVQYPRSVEVCPAKPKETEPHPLGLAVSDLIDMAHREGPSTTLAVFLRERLQRVSDAKVAELAALLNGSNPGLPKIDFKKPARELEWPQAESLIRAFAMVKWIAPESNCLRPIGAEQIQKAMTAILAPDFAAVTERPPKIYRGGIPFLVEAAIAWGGNAGHVDSSNQRGGDIVRYANAAPLLFDVSGCAITKAVKDVEWKRYNIQDFEQAPITVFVNVVSVYVPYTSAGKQALSDEDEVYQEIKYAIMEVARKVQLHVGGIRREHEQGERRKAILRYVQQLSRDLTDLANKGKSEELAKRLTDLIETKYMGQIMEGKNEDGSESSNGNGKKKKGEDEEDEEEE